MPRLPLLIVPFLLLVACADSGETAADDGWLAQVGPAIAADARRFEADGDGWSATAGGVGIRLDGPRLTLDGVQVETVAFGRRGNLRPVQVERWSPGDCTLEQDPTGACIRRLEAEDDGLTHWTATRADGAWQGWTVAAAPAGAGPVRIVVRADAVVDVGESLLLTGADGAQLLVHDLDAWDADGDPLPIRFVPDPEGFAIEVDDTGASWPIEIDPVYSSASITLTGSSSSDKFGSAVAGVGDINHDGYEDVVVGAYAFNSSKGRLYSFHGSSTGLSTSAAATIPGAAGSSFGYAVAGAGDVDLDGYDDVLVGAPTYGSNAGRVQIYYGGATGISTSSVTTLTGLTDGYFGSSLSTAGDVNRDGYADIVCGAPYASSTYGVARVYYGSASGIANSADVTLTGTSATSLFGFSVAGGADVNADGYDDVEVGAPGSSTGTGAVYVHHGSASGLSSTATTTLTGSAVLGAFGFSVAALGDTNGDGYGDIAVGAPTLYTSSIDYFIGTGAAYVYSGSSAGVTTSGVVTLSSGAANDGFGSAVAALGDLEQDGYADVAVGAEDAASSAGEIRVYGGSSTGVSSAALTTLTGGASADLGWSVGAADTNNDGYRDVLGGAPGVVSSTTSGAVYVYRGYGYDHDGDGYYTATDCDDTDASVNPGASEVCDGAGVDEDCDGLVDDADPTVAGTTAWYTDDDGDGYGSGLAATACVQPSGTSAVNTDCDDTSSDVHPGGAEICDADNADEDCDGAVDDADTSVDVSSMSTFYLDADHDGYGGTTTTAACDAPASYTATPGDCNDVSVTINPAGTEICDAADADEDCDGLVDDADPTTSASTKTVSAWADTDGDGHGAGATASFCAMPVSGYSADKLDCDDTNAAISPGLSEVCDAADVDENCNGVADDDDSATLASSKTSWYPDSDSDGYGGAVGMPACDQPAGYVAISGDCNEGDASQNPAATEVCDPANVDEDCDGLADDNDSSAASAGKSTGHADADGDGFGGDTTALYCDLPSGWVLDSSDCDDTNSAVKPGATEVCDTADVDEDCDSLVDDADPSVSSSTKATFYRDVDADGYGSATTTSACDLPSGYTAFSGDCDDTVGAINPGAVEACDAADTDEDCDGVADDADASVDVSTKTSFFTDHDGDAYGGTDTGLACDASGSLTATGGDCDDTHSTVNPAAAEVCDAADLDEDCDGLVDDADPSVSGLAAVFLDADGDGYGGTTTAGYCDLPAGWVVTEGDCDDSDPAINPGASEADCGDPIDYNCDGSTGLDDHDGDGWGACEECDDGDATLNPGATEVCDAANVDEDCDGYADDADASVDLATATVWYGDADADGYAGGAPASLCDASEGYGTDSLDCDDTRADVSPAGAEVCDATDADEDCDGLINDADPSVDTTTALHVYADTDGDGYGTDSETRACSVTDGFASSNGDCDDTSASINPGAPEVCDDADVDEDCDGLADDADNSVDPASTTAWHADSDGDGFGDPDTTTLACDPGESATSDASDCDDSDAAISPVGVELPGDLVDGNCDALEECFVDGDGDGYAGDTTVLTDDLTCATGDHRTASDPAGDCDDDDAAFHPAATEDCAVPVDYNCDGVVGDVDTDLDGWSACAECDDTRADVNPDAAEICDGVDNDCDGTADGADAEGATVWYADQDLDGFTTAESVTDCTPPVGYGEASAEPDCDDQDASVNPSATEVEGDGIDQDCDGDDVADTGNTGETGDVTDTGGKGGALVGGAGCACNAGPDARAGLPLLMGLALLLRRRRVA